jgi:serine/threonine protein kinase
MLSGYTTLHKLGEGHTAKVFAATKDDDGTPCVIKHFHKRFDYYASTEFRFYDRLNQGDESHPGKKHVIRAFLCEKEYIVMERYDGDLLSLLDEQDEGFSEPFCQDLARQMLLGLAYTHSCGIIHTDIKLENVLYRKVDDTYHFVITDFGVAEFTEDEHDPNSMIQTRQYRCFETLMHQPVHLASDLPSVFAVVYEMATNKFLFNYRDSHDHAMAIIKSIGLKNVYSSMKTDDVLPVSLEKRIHELENHEPELTSPFHSVWDDAFVSLGIVLLHPLPHCRGTAMDALHHPWIMAAIQPDEVYVAEPVYEETSTVLFQVVKV